MSIPSWAERAAETPAAPALITVSRTWSCVEIAAAIEERVERLRDAPLVALTGAASTEHVLDLFAAIDARVPALMLHPRWTAHEADAIIARARPSLVIEAGQVVRTETHAVPRVLTGTLAIVATSGTTGTPKLAVLSRRAFETSAWASASHLGASGGDRWLLAMPLSHVGGLGVALRSLVYRTPLVLHEASGSTWLSLARSAQVTHVSLVPTALARLLDRGEPLSRSVRVILLGGAACPASLLERAIAASMPIHPTYGLTETCGQVATAPRPIVHPEDALAVPLLPGVEVHVENGTIRVRSASAMDGWLDAESPYDTDGFYDTGDLGELDGGRIRIHARRSDLVVSGGENVYPREVEDVLERIHGVTAACVFGVPDIVWGQRVAVAMVTRGDAPSDDEILVRARRELAGFKVPRLIARLDALELGASGKIDRARTAARSIPYLRAV